MYKLNQVETDLRNKIDMDTKDDLVHEVQERGIGGKSNKGRNDEKGKDNRKEKKYYTVEGYNYEDLSINAILDEEECDSKGIFIDRRE
ncbi:hypothetical protein KQI77_09865 [Clostridium sp. MSJ-8]|uniref:hypothetical protein n=1 Tax=Clostridium sp. MSJ-8 TaxID=2841510 RepID=UPI001C0F0580|nr:hypothetical protein [Clostridium sp. MSJ-8]MBU5488438.1 hypothetical protein [Clostridium sp. MSJ-8]